MSIPGILWSIGGVMWMAGAFFQFKADQPVIAWMSISVGAMNIAVGAMYFVMPK